MTTLENDFVKMGWARCPNKSTRWYAAGPGKLEPVFPLEVRVTDKIWVVTKRYGYQDTTEIPLLAFENVESFNNYLKENGRESKPGASPGVNNVWD